MGHPDQEDSDAYEVVWSEKSFKPAPTEVEAQFSEANRAATNQEASAESGGRHGEVGQLSGHLYSVKLGARLMCCPSWVHA